MAERRRDIQLKFYVTEQERLFIVKKMKQLSTNNMGAYLRKMAIDGYVIQVDYSAIKKETHELQKIGVNINQIAKRINTTGSIYEQDLNTIKDTLKRIWQLQRYILSKVL